MIDISNILCLAGDGYTAHDIRKFTRVHLKVIEQVCRQAGVALPNATQPPAIVIVKDSRKEAETRYQLKQAALEAATPTHPYDQFRRTCTPYELAHLILRQEGIIYRHAGADFIDGKCATPLRVMQEANRVLKRLNLDQIEGSPDWRV